MTKINIKTFFYIWIIVLLIILMTDIIVYLNGLYEYKYIYLFRKYLNPATERNIPTLISAFSFYFIGLLSKKIFSNPKTSLFFYIFFIYLALDDLFMIHEQIGSLLGRLYLAGKVVSYYWHYIYDPILIIVLIIFYILLLKKFLKKNNFLTIIYLTLGYMLYAFTQFLDFFEGLHTNLAYLQNLTTLSKKELIHLLRDIEEIGEIIANICIAYSIVLYLQYKSMIIYFKIKFNK